MDLNVNIMAKSSNSDDDDGHHGHLHGFPYHPELERYVINKKQQREKLWKPILNPKGFLSEMKKEDLVWKILFWLGIIFAIMAIIIGLIKELKEGEEEVDEDLVLHLSYIELVFAITSITISLSKHSIKYNGIIKLQKNVKTKRQKSDDEDQLSNRKKLIIAIILFFLSFIFLLVGGFLILHFKDKSSHEDLLYMKYTTTITLFIVLALDGVINDVVNDAFAQAKLDQSKILVHQMFLELKGYLHSDSSSKRAAEIEEFLQSSELLTLEAANHVFKVSSKSYEIPIEHCTVVDAMENVELKENQNSISENEKQNFIIDSTHI